jgi:predicted MarR family transcription regulator
MSESENPRRVGPIVSSAHLAVEGSEELSELEFGLIIANNAFERWIVRCMAAAGVSDVSALDVLVLHSINHRGRARKMADICFVLNVEDTHTVVYALKKLEKLGLVRGERRGKEKFFVATAKGRGACERYGVIRQKCLLHSMTALGGQHPETGKAAGLLRMISGLYDQAARAAASL